MKFDMVNALSTQRQQVDQKLNNMIARGQDASGNEKTGLEHELACFTKSINQLKVEIKQLQREEQELKL